MNIKDALIQEHSKAQIKRVTDYIDNDPNHFKELVDLFLHGESMIAQRAAWALGHSGILHPELVQPYQQALLKKLTAKGIHDAIKRNILRIWIYHMPPEKLWGELFDICYGFARSKDEPGAIRAFSLYVLGHIAVNYPELAGEVRMLIEDLKPAGTPAILSSGKKVLKQLEKV